MKMKKRLISIAMAAVMAVGSTLSPGEHRNFHSERFRPRWYVSEFHDSIFQSVFKALNRFRKALGIGVDHIAALP